MLGPSLRIKKNEYLPGILPSTLMSVFYSLVKKNNFTKSRGYWNFKNYST